MSDREPGFYWVRVVSEGPEWAVAQRRDEGWVITGWDQTLRDKDFSEIGPKIEREDSVAAECARIAECAIEHEPGSTDTGRMWRNNTAMDIARAIREQYGLAATTPAPAPTPATRPSRPAATS